MTGRSKYSLGTDVLAAIAKAKDDYRMSRLREYHGKELLTRSGRRGARLLEAYVGEARPEDCLGTAGRRRLVLLIEAGRITEMYFSEDHYHPGSWSRITDF
jgi:hypothetical protein